MIDLDKPDQFSKIDTENLLKNIEEFPMQCERAWQEIKKVVMPSYYVTIKNIVVLGMGGSAIGGDMLKGFIEKKSRLPLVVSRDYDLPKFVDKESLVISVSYSGNTEETLEATKQAITKKAKIICIATGGKLEEMAKSNKLPIYKFDYKTEPRQAFGFSFVSVLGILNKIGVIDVEDEEFRESILILRGLHAKLRSHVATSSNQAKKIAKSLYNKIPIVFGSSFLIPAARRFKTQLNENSKQMAMYEEMPEACHNFIVGLLFPNNLSDEIFVLFLSSKFEHPRVRLRQNVILEILKKNRIPYEELNIEPAPTPLSEMLSFVFVLDFTSFYLAMLNRINPREIENIKFLKTKLEDTPWQR